MQSQIHFERDASLYLTARRALAPTGGAIVDGFRLAVVNAAFLIAALAIAGILSVLGRVVRWIIPVPLVSPGIIVLGLSILFAAVVWYRYAALHGRMAQAGGRDVHPDRFGLIAGAPFGVLALLLLASGLFGLVVSVAGFSFSGVSAAVGRIIFAALFGLLAAGCVGIARLATRKFRA
jgi:uncharacterized membrane protein